MLPRQVELVPGGWEGLSSLSGPMDWILRYIKAYHFKGCSQWHLLKIKALYRSIMAQTQSAADCTLRKKERKISNIYMFFTCQLPRTHIVDFLKDCIAGKFNIF